MEERGRGEARGEEGRKRKRGGREVKERGEGER